MNEVDRKLPATGVCPLCGKPTDAAFKPWLSGVYAVPAKEEEDEDGARPAEGEAGEA